MTLYSAINPYPVILNQTGTGLNGGSVYIGLAGQDPQTFPMQVYWDEGGTIPAAQPLATIGGYIYRSGSPAQAYPAGQPYSIRVLDRFGTQIFEDLSVSGALATLVSGLASAASGAGAGLIGFSQSATYDRSTDGYKDQQTVSPMDHPYNAAGDGATDDTTAVNAATAEIALRGVRGPILLDKSFKVSSTTAWSNPYGIQPLGSGGVFAPITGGLQQLSTYSDVPGRLVIGREYLRRVFQRAALGQSGTWGRIGCFLYGDSTVANGYMSVTTEAYLKALFEIRGVGNIAITNRGAAGTMVSALDALPDLSPTTDLIIIKYGINDGGNPEATRLATFQSTFDAKLAAIRADPNGSVGSLAIVLVGPNTTGDTPNGRDERWYEQLRGVYVTLARKYQCVYIDVYGAFKDPRGGAGLWLDNPFGDGRGIHPLDPLGFPLWTLVADSIITQGEGVTFGTSSFRNLSSTVFAPINGALPSQWSFGQSVGRAQVGSGWPREGVVSNLRNPDGPTLQILWPFAQNDTRMMIRTAYTTGDTFNRWTSAPENLSLSNGWVAAGTVSGTVYATPGAFIDVSGVVHLRGGMKSGTTAAGTLVATLPAGMIPANDETFTCQSSTATPVGFRVAAGTGQLTLLTTGDATVTSLSNIKFLAA